VASSRTVRCSGSNEDVDGVKQARRKFTPRFRGPGRLNLLLRTRCRSRPHGVVRHDDVLETFRKSWVLMSFGHTGVTPRWRKQGGWKPLPGECQAAFQRINLHWHDLRHEYASRVVERHVPLAQVRDLLGHASIVTTERYDNQTLENLQAAAARLESGKPSIVLMAWPARGASRCWEERFWWPALPWREPPFIIGIENPATRTSPRVGNHCQHA
jgi:hypothetical protein